MATVTIELMGGLGNQLFQIWTTIAYALKTNKKFVFLDTDVLRIGIDRPTYWNNFLKSLKPYTEKQICINNGYNEPFFHFAPIPEYNCDIKLLGYFQSWKYFEEKKEEIKKLLKIDETRQIIQQQFNDLIQKVTASMHFRFGDYKSKFDYHPILSVEYYEKALFDLLKNRNNEEINVLYFVENEDLEMARSYIKQLKEKLTNISFLEVPSNIEDWQQLLLMSYCKNNIIANSTFSWWAAYLNDYENKQIYYPFKWFGPQANINDIEDLFFPEWKKIVF